MATSSAGVSSELDPAQLARPLKVWCPHDGDVVRPGAMPALICGQSRPRNCAVSSATEAVSCSSSAFSRALECRPPCCPPGTAPLRPRPSRQPARCEDCGTWRSMPRSTRRRSCRCESPFGRRRRCRHCGCAARPRCRRSGQADWLRPGRCRRWRAAGTPALTRAFLTASARRCDSATLKSGEPTVSVWPVSVTVALPALL